MAIFCLPHARPFDRLGSGTSGRVDRYALFRQSQSQTGLYTSSRHGIRSMGTDYPNNIRQNMMETGYFDGSH